MRERENKLRWGRGEGRFILLGLFILERHFWKKIFFVLWWRRTWLIIYDVTLSWNYISESNYSSQLYITWYRLRHQYKISRDENHYSKKTGTELQYESFIIEFQMTRNRQKGEIQIARFAPTRLIISIFHHLIGQHFESGLLQNFVYLC